MEDFNKAFEYGATAIKDVVGAEKHRINVSQYLGSDDTVGIENQLFEILDNSIDECLEYRQILLDTLSESGVQQNELDSMIPPIRIELTITPSDEVIITDMGRGLPVLPHQSTGEPTIFRIYESDSAGGKGNLAQGGYRTMTAGMHGAGAAVSKSCTDRFEILTKTNGVDGKGRGIYSVIYVDGERDKTRGQDGLVTVSQELQLSSVPELGRLNIYETGTSIRYKYAESVFSKKKEGQPCEEAYDDESITKRIKDIMLAVEDPNSIVIIYKFKDKPEIEIKPSDVTPEIVLGNGTPINKENILPLNFISNKNRNDPSFFKANVYIYYNQNQLGFKSKTIVNRLSLDVADANDYVKQAIKEMYEQNIAYNIPNADAQIKSQMNVAKSNVVMDLVSHSNVLIVMQLARAKFDGQTKRNLKSKDYITEFSRLVRSAVKYNADGYFRNLIEYGNNVLSVMAKGIVESEKQRQRQIKKTQNDSEIQNAVSEAKMIAQDPIKRIEQYMSIYDSKSMMTLKSTIHPVKDSWLVLVEGASAAGALGQIDNLPITVVGLQGKPSNTTNMVSIDKQQIKDLLTQLTMPYKAIGIMTDADSDGMHIRILLLAAIMRFVPQYVSNGKVFIINSPNAKLQNVSDEEIQVQVFNKTYRYPPNSLILTKTPVETDILLHNYKEKVVLLEKYGGLADSTTDGDTNLSLINLLEDPDYRSVIVSPTEKEKNILNDILSKDSTLKKAIADQICTERMRYIRNVSNINNRIRLKGLDLFNQSYDSVPKISHHEMYTYENIECQDVNEVF